MPSVRLLANESGGKKRGKEEVVRGSKGTNDYSLKSPYYDPIRNPFSHFLKTTNVVKVQTTRKK